MQTGPVVFPNPFFMAPMAGVTDSVVRILARRYDCGMVTTEMVASNVLADRGTAATLGRMQYRAIEKPIAIQIFGADATILAEAARRVEAAGADIVDLNLGCSVPKIANIGGGASLCRRLSTLGPLLEKVASAVTVPVTVKIRKGWDDHHLTAFEVLRIAQESGIQGLTIHARTSEQGYSGQADWDFIRALKASARIPIVGNGDIASAADALRMLEHTGCDAVMIGRACRGNPWIFRECLRRWKTGEDAPAPTLEEKFTLIREHFELALSEEGTRAGLVTMRKMLGWYTRGLPCSATFREKIFRIREVAELRQTLEEFFTLSLATQHAA